MGGKITVASPCNLPKLYVERNQGAGRDEGIRVEDFSVNDSKVRSQVWGFDGYERPFALVPRRTDGGVIWEKKHIDPHSWHHTTDPREQQQSNGIPCDSGLDLYSASLRNVDVGAVRQYGVAFGIDTNKGEFWLQEPGRNFKPIGTIHT